MLSHSLLLLLSTLPFFLFIVFYINLFCFCVLTVVELILLVAIVFFFLVIVVRSSSMLVVVVVVPIFGVINCRLLF
jgi:hypothetical protein